MSGQESPIGAAPAKNLPGRYFVAAAGMFLADLVLAMTLREGVGLPVWLAAAISFAAVGAGGYFVHEHWTFRRAGSRASAGRFTRNIAALLAAFSTRVGVIAAMEAVHDPGATLAAAYVGIGAAASLTVNFLLNRFWVFRKKG